MTPQFIAAEFLPSGYGADDPRPAGLRGGDFRQRADALREGDFTYYLVDAGTPLPPHASTALDLAQKGVTWDVYPVTPPAFVGQPESPFDWGGSWRRVAMTDRWTRIRAALEIGRARRADGANGWLILPAHDARYSRQLLLQLVDFSRRHAQNGVPAAVSPYTFYKHSPLEGVNIPAAIIDGVNAAFNRDPAFRLRLERGEAQGFWGKMGMIPFAMCADLLRTVDTGVWEDDLELDRAITALGYAARALWIDDPARYRQTLLVTDEAGVRRVIERHLHYSLRTGGSALTEPLSDMARYMRVVNPRFGAASTWADHLIAEEYARMMRRVDQHGASWVDWGAYRHVARPYDPHVEVWQRI